MVVGKEILVTNVILIVTMVLEIIYVLGVFVMQTGVDQIAMNVLTILFV